MSWSSCGANSVWLNYKLTGTQFQAVDVNAVPFNAAATRYPDNAEILMWLGHAYRRAGELTAATERSNAENWGGENPASIVTQPAKFGLDLIVVPAKQPFEPVWAGHESPADE